LFSQHELRHESPDWNETFINIHKNWCDAKLSAKAADINILLVGQKALRNSEIQPGVMEKIDRLSA
jgi:hypothetical protein